MPKIKDVPVSWKAGPDDGLGEGEFVVYPSTFTREPDAYGDVVKQGAFADTIKHWQDSGNVLPGLYGHRMDDPDFYVAEATNMVEDEHGWRVEGKFDLESPKGKQVYRLVKGRRLNQLSFAYDTADEGQVELDDGKKANELRKVNVHEFSFVPVGANQDTAVVAIKSAIGPKSTDTTDDEWDGAAMEKRLPDDAGESTYRQMYAWVNPDGDADTRSAYKFPHHQVSTDGDVGAANTNACSAVIAALNGGRGGSSIPDGDRQGVYNHVAKHLKDADMDVPDLKASETLVKADRSISAKNEQRIKDVVTALQSVLSALEGDQDDEASGKADANTDASTKEPEQATVSVSAEERKSAPSVDSNLAAEIELLAIGG
jgi:HK97 family phage prohead protease